MSATSSTGRQESRGFVALATFVDDERAVVYEEGGLYDHEPHGLAAFHARAFVDGEDVVACPRCGQRFAATAFSSGNANGNVHVAHGHCAGRGDDSGR